MSSRTREEIDAIVDANNIKELVNDKKCPICGSEMLDTNIMESCMTINAARNVWHCFSCNSGGDPIRYIMHRYRVNFNNAIDILEKRMKGEKA
jgi:hypothetical protein